MAQSSQVTLDIDSDGAEESTSNTRTNLLRVEPGARPAPPARGHLGLGDRLNSVFREIRPLVEHARMVRLVRSSNVVNNMLCSWKQFSPFTSNMASSQCASSTRKYRSRSTEATELHSPREPWPGATTFIVTDRGGGASPVRPPAPQGLTTSASNDSNLSDMAAEHPEINISVNPANNNNIHDNADNESQSDDGNQQVVDLRSTLNLLIKYAPFYFILFIKFMYDMREGLFTFLVLFCTFSHSNSLVRRENGKQMSRSLKALIFELFFTVGCIGSVHYLFGHGKLLPNLVMFPYYKESIDIWELLWLVVLTDLIGKVYLFVEAVSQLYRSLLTIQPWVFYLMNSYDGSERMVGMFLTSVYVIAKVIELLVRLRLFKNATWTLLQSVNLGTKPTGEQLLSAGDSCPICHDDYATPWRLGCGHIFCELCIAAWLDREHTCPLCRAKVADEPTWRDGSTTYDFQLY
ncbi:unnamed protein product [Plutella xylostella]|uniref:(diamondback moth) hypothetical protein n=1 Tax=Plutella xylostella TaxID=51655 RepID=A0A8S4G512_PLUXY|nr:unnamed protein product [Plutella xylostella]